MISTIAQEMEAVLTTIFEDACEEIGEIGAEEMRKHLLAGDGKDTERLLQSLSWATSRARRTISESALKEGDLPEKPTQICSVNIGTGVPYAPQVNYGSLPMGRGGSGSVDPESGTFQEKIKEWAERHGVDTSTPEGQSHLFFIMKKIKENGTDAVPFYEPSLSTIRMKAPIVINALLSKGLKQKYRPQVIIVDSQKISKVNTAAQGGA